MKSTNMKQNFLLFMFFCTTLIVHGQNKLYIYEKDGSNQSFTLSSISKLTFSEDQIFVNRNTGNPVSFSIANVDYMKFKSSSISISEIQAENLSVYPNPVTSNLTVKNETVIDELRIFDIQGKLHLQLSPKEEIVNIDMSNFPTGIYFLQIINKNQVHTSKIIKTL